MSKTISISKAGYTTTEAQTTTTKSTWFDKQAEKFEASRFAVMTILMTAQSCLGSVAAMFLLQGDAYVLLAICASVTLVANSAFIAQVPAKWCLSLFYLSVIVNISLIVAGLLM